MSRSLVSWRRLAATVVVCGLLAALLSGCNGPTTVEQAEKIGNYNISFGLQPDFLNPPQNAALTYGVVDAKTNKPVTQFDVVDGALFHNVLISRDLTVFQHSYASRSLLDQFSMATEFPQKGQYYSFTLFKPTGGDLQVLTGTIQAGNEGNPPQLTPDADRARDSYGSHFELITGNSPIRAGQPSQLAVYVTERGAPVTTVWPFLGAPGYLWVIGQDGNDFAVEVGASSGTPMAGSSGGQAAPAPTYMPGLQSALASRTAQPVASAIPVQQTAQVSIVETPGAVTPDIGYGPTMAFTHTFPHAGLYKVWAEMEYRAQTIAVGWVLNVTP